MLVVGATAGFFLGHHSSQAPSSASTQRVAAAAAEPIDSAPAPATIPTTCLEPAQEDAPIPEQVFVTALEMSEGEDKAARLTAAFSRWLDQSPTSALRDIDRIPADYRLQVIGAALSQLAASEPGRALEYAEGITENRANHLASIVSVIAQRDPQRAVEIATGQQYRDPTGEILRSLLPVLAASNLELARSTVEHIDKPSLESIQQVANEYARTDPLGAYDWAIALAEQDGRDARSTAIEALSESIALRSVEAASDLLTRIEDPSIKVSLIRAISQRMGQEDLRSAWTWLNQYRTDAGYSENARNLLHRWSYVKPQEVAEILPTVADQEIRVAVVDELSSAWQKKDPGAYRSWVESLAPSGTPR